MSVASCVDEGGVGVLCVRFWSRTGQCGRIGGRVSIRSRGFQICGKEILLVVLEVFRGLTQS